MCRSYFAYLYAFKEESINERLLSKRIFNTPGNRNTKKFLIQRQIRQSDLQTFKDMSTII